jgi:hypothetical protein
MNDPTFYILDARELLGPKTTITKALEEFSYKLTIFVCKKTSNKSMKKSEVFISGSQSDYGVKVGDLVSYKNDINMPRGSGLLEVQNIIFVNPAGDISSENDLGINEKRPWFVLK